MSLEEGALYRALAAVTDERALRIVTIGGDPASGTALVGRFLDGLSDAAVVRGGFSWLTPFLGLGPLPEVVGVLTDATNRPLEDIVDAGAPWMLPALQDVLGLADDPRELAEVYSAAGHLVDIRTAETPTVIALYDVHLAGHGFLNLVRFLRERGTRALLMLCLGDDSLSSSPTWRAVAGPDAIDITPRSSGEDLAATLSDLDERDRALLAACAAAGTDVTDVLLTEVLGDVGDDLAERQDQLAQEALLVSDGRERYSCREHVGRAVRATCGAPTPATHEAFARALCLTTAARTRPEVIAAHFERAGRMGAAARFLFAAGHASLQRGDMPAAADLLRRCARVLPAGDPLRMKALAAALDALMAIGRVDDARAVSRSARAEAEGVRDECRSVLFGFWERMLAGVPGVEGPVEAEHASAVHVLTGCGDVTGAAQVEEARAHALWEAGDAAASIESMESASRHVSDRPTRARIAVWLLMQSLDGPEAIHVALRRCEELSDVSRWSALVEVKRVTIVAALEAARGNRSLAEAGIGAARRMQDRLGQPGWVARVPQAYAWISLLGGDAAAAEEHVGAVFEELESVGHPVAVETGVLLARALVQRERFGEADDVAARCRQLLDAAHGLGVETTSGEVDAIATRARARMGLAPESSVNEIVERLPPERYALRRCDALLDLADAAAALGDTEEAQRLCEDAIVRYEAKGATACATGARKALADLGRQV